MIVLVETRTMVAKAYLDGLDRLGVVGLLFDPVTFVQWVESSAPHELAAVEGVVAGDFDGREGLSRYMPRLGHAPLVALLDKRTLDSTLALFSAGFDDVIGKPAHVQEILARVHRIASRRRAGHVSFEAKEIVAFSDGRDPVVNGEVLCLPRRERRILECLYNNEGAWVTKTQIFNRVYGLFNDQYDESVIESHICRLRRRLKGALGYDPVESQRYLGYRLRLRATDVPATASHAQSRFDSLAQAAM